jgi:hypothetical protein
VALRRAWRAPFWQWYFRPALWLLPAVCSTAGTFPAPLRGGLEAYPDLAALALLPPSAKEVLRAAGALGLSWYSLSLEPWLADRWAGASHAFSSRGLVVAYHVRVVCWYLAAQRGELAHARACLQPARARLRASRHLTLRAQLWPYLWAARWTLGLAALAAEVLQLVTLLPPERRAALLALCARWYAECQPRMSVQFGVACYAVRRTGLWLCACVRRAEPHFLAGLVRVLTGLALGCFVAACHVPWRSLLPGWWAYASSATEAAAGRLQVAGRQALSRWGSAALGR